MSSKGEIGMNERAAIRDLAMGTAFTVADLDIAWRHMREIEGLSFDRFATFVVEIHKSGIVDISRMAQAVQKVCTGQVMMRTTFYGY